MKQGCLKWNFFNCPHTQQKSFKLTLKSSWLWMNFCHYSFPTLLNRFYVESTLSTRAKNIQYSWNDAHKLCYETSAKGFLPKFASQQAFTQLMSLLTSMKIARHIHGLFVGLTRTNQVWHTHTRTHTHTHTRQHIVAWSYWTCLKHQRKLDCHGCTLFLFAQRLFWMISH